MVKEAHVGLLKLSGGKVVPELAARDCEEEAHGGRVDALDHLGCESGVWEWAPCGVSLGLAFCASIEGQVRATLLTLCV